MSRYIDKKQFREALISYTQTFNDKYTIQDPSKLFDYLCGIANLLNRYPTADVRETVRGEWITCEDIDGKYRFCSACRSYSAYKTDFCPNCGADMRGEENERTD